jgi:hypothetical protein
MLYDSAAHPNEAILMVRLNHLIEGQQKAKYIRVQYKYSKWTSNLPMEGFNSKEQWRLLLFRETSCDAPLEMQPSFDGNAEHYDKNPLPVLKRAKNSETAKLPAKESLPCYMLKSGDFSLVK